MKYFLLAVLAPLIMFANAQEGTKVKNVEKYPKVKWRKKVKIAKAKMEEGSASYYNAAQYLEDAYKVKPEKIKIPHMLAETYRLLRDYQSAEKYYKVVVDKKPEAYANDMYYLGLMQKMNGKYDDARKTLNSYLKTELGKNDLNFKSIARIDIVGCDTATFLIANPTKIKVEHTEGINGAMQEYSPKPISGNRIIFAAQKTDTAVNITKSNADYYAAIFTAEKSGKTYTNKTLFPAPVNGDTVNIGSVALSLDEKTIVFTKCEEIASDNYGDCKLYRSKKEGNGWSTPEELKSLNSDKGTSTQPAYGVDGEGNEILYFVSGRNGKNKDIYYAKVNTDGTFGTVTSAGDAINSIGDDVSPYYDPKNKVLYFSSDGHPSLGGLDVFKVYGAPGKWTSTAMNAGVPINSSADDFYLALDQKGAKGFMISNRVGTMSTLGQTCCDDIWTVIVQRDVFLKAIYVKRGDATNTPVEGVDASMYKVAGNNFEFVANAKTTNEAFVFPVLRNTAYKINGNKEGYWPSIDNITINEDEERDTIEQIFYIDPIVKKKIRIPNVYFAFDKSNVITFYQKEIDSVVAVLNANPGYSVEVQGHTDNKGTDEYNEKLSLRRANEVKTFLTKKKDIAANRIVVKTFGEKMPAVPNELPNGEDDPEGRARNRRVEFKIIPDKPEDAPDFENYGDPVKETKTGPGFTYGVKKK